MVIKSQTLKKTYSALQESSVLDFVIIKVEEWKQNKEFSLNKTQAKLKGETVIIRSSILVENGETKSFFRGFWFSERRRYK